MDDGISSSCSDSVITSKEKKNCCTTFEIQMKIQCLSLKKEDDALVNNRLKKPSFMLRPIKNMLKSEVETLSLQQLHYEMDLTDLPDYLQCFCNRILCSPYLLLGTYLTQVIH